jgi:DNA invertase Pin-like site-specific DNA recombinase
VFWKRVRLLDMLNCPYCEHELSPSEIGSLYATLGGRALSSLKAKDVAEIRRSNDPTKELAEKYQVHFSTIRRIKQKKSWASELNCPYCKHELSRHEIGILYSTLGGSTTSPLKSKTSAVNGSNVAKLTWNDVDTIRKSTASIKELSEKYKVHYNTLWRVKNYKAWKKPR